MIDAIGTSRIGVALVGAGMIAQTHVTAVSDIRDRVKLEAIISTRPERAKHLIEYYAGSPPILTSDLSAITENPDVQVVIVATPPSVRLDLIEKLAKAGKHILLEKPVARTADEALQIVEICERAGITLGILLQHRMHPPSKEAAKLIASDELGKPGLVEIAVPNWREQSYYNELGRGTYARDGGGVLLTQAIHTIDLALSLTGAVTRVQAMTATTTLHEMESEDLAVAGLHFASGAFGSLVATTACFPSKPETINLHFEHGSLRLGTDSLDVFWRDGRCEKGSPDNSSGNDGGPTINNHAWHQAVIEDFIDAVQHSRPPMVSGREALVSHRLIEAIETSSRLGTAIDII